MSRAYQLEALLVALERASDLARKADMDLHFVSDISHLIAVVVHHKKELANDSSAVQENAQELSA